MSPFGVFSYAGTPQVLLGHDMKGSQGDTQRVIFSDQLLSVSQWSLDNFGTIKWIVKGKILSKHFRS
jgi:hypothetical protein